MTHAFAALLLAFVTSLSLSAFAGGSSGGTSGGDRPGTGRTTDEHDNRYPHLEEHYEEYNRVRPKTNTPSQADTDRVKEANCGEDYKSYRQAAMSCPSYAIPVRIFGSRSWICSCNSRSNE